MTEKLTDQQREWREHISEAISELNDAIIEIGGAYQPTVTALQKLQQVSEIAIDDEDLGPCESCGAAIWSIAEDEHIRGEDGIFCMDCVNRWNEPDNT